MQEKLLFKELAHKPIKSKNELIVDYSLDKLRKEKIVYGFIYKEVPVYKNEKYTCDRYLEQMEIALEINGSVHFNENIVGAFYVDYLKKKDEIKKKTVLTKYLRILNMTTNASKFPENVIDGLKKLVLNKTDSFYEVTI